MSHSTAGLLLLVCAIGAALALGAASAAEAMYLVFGRGLVEILRVGVAADEGRTVSVKPFHSSSPGTGPQSIGDRRRSRLARRTWASRIASQSGASRRRPPAQGFGYVSGSGSGSSSERGGQSAISPVDALPASVPWSGHIFISKGAPRPIG